MKRWLLCLYALLVVAALYACSGKTRESAGLQLIIATDLATPEEMDQVRIEIRQQTAPRQWGAPSVKELRVPADFALPTSYAITAGKGDNNVQIRLVGKKNALPVVLSVVETRVPTDRVASLQLTLSRACSGQLSVDVNGMAQSSCPNVADACQAETGQCGPVITDSSKLPSYRDGDEDRAVARGADAGARDAAPDAPVLSASREITRFSVAGVDGVISGNDINVLVATGTDVTNVAPILETTGVAVSPASGVAQDFSVPVTYTVTAESGQTRSYKVTVTVAPSSAKAMVSFSILGVSGAIGDSTITLTLPTGTDRTSLIPTFKTTGVTTSPASGVARDFTNPVVYTVQAEDGSVKKYTVTVSVTPSSAKEITKFTLSGVDAAIADKSITVTVPSGTSVTSLVPSIAHVGASISPAAVTARDFTNPVQYTVTAADGSFKTYTVTVTVAGGSAKDITAFSVNGVQGVITGANITVTLPFGSSVTSLTPSVSITGTSVAPASGAPQSFTSPVVYTVTAADLSTKTFTVNVGVAGSAAKDIASFSLLGSAGTIAGTSISVTVPSGTNVTSLAPSIAITGASVSPANGVATNFTNPVTYVVTAGDGSTKPYQVTVTVAASSQKDISSFMINGQSGSIVGQSIGLTLPFGTDVTNLTPSLQITGVSVNPISGSQRNFSSPQTYTVTAADASTKSYTVTVTVAPSSDKEITSFSIQGFQGIINGTSISVTMPSGTNVTNLVPAIQISGASVNPANGVAQNFSTPQTYVVTAADASTKSFLVTVTVAGGSAKEITSFVILGVIGTIDNFNNQIFLTLPSGTDRSNLVPTIMHNGASVNPGSGVPHNFNSTSIYTVTAADLTQRQYSVTVNLGPGSPSKDITSFVINSFAGNINQNTGQIFLDLPGGTPKGSLVPTIVHTGMSITPGSGVAQDFNNPVTYNVQASDLTFKQYTVYVTTGGGPPKDITSFAINGVQGQINGLNILVTLPVGTNVTSLSPVVTYSGQSYVPLGAQDFTNPVPYTVTAIDSSTKTYSATVTLMGGGNCPQQGYTRCNFSCGPPFNVCTEQCDMGNWIKMMDCFPPDGGPPPPPGCNQTTMFNATCTSGP